MVERRWQNRKTHALQQPEVESRDGNELRRSRGDEGEGREEVAKLHGEEVGRGGGVRVARR
jgi:hypothetical protein